VKPSPAPPQAPAAAPEPPAQAFNADAPFRAEKPSPLPTEPKFEAPVPVERKLSNGARLLVVENHALPLVSVEVTIETGVDGEPLDKRGLAGFTAALLGDGTKGKTTLQLAVAEEELAAQVFAQSHLDSIGVHLNALKEKLPESVALLGEVLLEPGFRKADIERRRALRLTDVAKKKGQPGALARDVVSKLLYGDKHPWGLPSGGTAKTLSAIKPEDVLRFNKTWFVPNNAVIVVAGDTTADEMQALLEKSLAGWKPHKLPKRPKESFPKPGPRSISLEDFPGGSQSQVWIASRSIAASDPDVVALLVANNVIGGLFTSRLNMNLREDKAYSYGVRSGIDFTGDTSELTAAGGMVATHTADAVAEMEKELAKFSNGEVSDAELARAKTALIRGLPARLETGGAVVGSLTELVLNHLPLDYYAKLPALVAAVTKADVARVVKRVFKPEEWPIVVVGPRKLSEEPLGKLGLGKVTVVEPQ
jgi:zinc protease